MSKNKDLWKEKLSPEEYYVLRQKGTERPFSGKYNMHSENGTYVCNACKTSLFDSATKFDSGCGWPSFDKSIESKIEYIQDRSLGMIRTEIICSNCQSHLGHVFEDGTTETGTRYCVNSVSLDFNTTPQFI